MNPSLAIAKIKRYLRKQGLREEDLDLDTRLEDADELVLNEILSDIEGTLAYEESRR